MLMQCMPELMGYSPAARPAGLERSMRGKMDFCMYCIVFLMITRNFLSVFRVMFLRNVFMAFFGISGTDMCYFHEFLPAAIEPSAFLA